MAEQDSITFSSEPDEGLLRRAEQALREWETFGNLELHSAWLYFGSISAATKALKMSPSSFRRCLDYIEIMIPLDELFSLPDRAIKTIINGAFMLLEMQDAERDALFSTTPPPVRGDDYAQMVGVWRQSQAEKWGAEEDGKFPIVAARDLLEIYVRMWKLRQQPREFFESADIKYYLQNAIHFREAIESLASTSKMCAAAIGIIREYEAYCRQPQST